MKTKNPKPLDRFLVTYARVSNSAIFTKAYALLGVVVLLATTVLWSILGAKIQSANADQLINSYLLNSPDTFHGAYLPGAHSFLIKWPIFWLIKSFGYSSAAFVFFTLALTLVTVAALAAILYMIERRPLIFGTLCLALASTLLLVPSVPSAGNLLPVNMAMLATRNLEYIVYIGALWLIVRPAFKSPKFWLAVSVLGLLVASDKLFLYLTLGGALLALVAYALSKGWNMVSVSVKWLLAGIAAAGVSAALLFSVSQHLVHITSQGNLGPYGLVQNAHGVYLGLIYGSLGLLANFGANPAFDTTVVKQVPHQAYLHLSSLGGLGLLVNIVIVFFGLYAVVKLLIHSFAHNRNKEVELDDHSRLAIMLIWSMLASVVVFVGSNHYYAGDARYLTISLFAVFISLAIWASQRNWRPEMVTTAGTVLFVAIVLAVPGVVHTYSHDRSALDPINHRNQLVAEALSHHPVRVLVGDYWRVIPTKFIDPKPITVLPLSSCIQPRQVLSSQLWQPNLKKNSFAYLLTLDGGLTDYPSCKLDQVINTYGRPNASIVIAGDYANPKELLLFYDKGSNLSSPKVALKNPSTVVPVSLDELPYTTCNVPTIINVVAHQDDDLLFMNPDILNDIKAGHCVRTVYVTAGDAGTSGQFYWLSREQGSEAAYARMAGTDDIWVQRIVKLADNEYISVANPRGNSKISLVFMHFPDGNVKGQGFPATGFESLEKLDSGKISSMQAVYSGSTYLPNQLVDALTALLHVYQPTEIRTQANLASKTYPDHSDHTAVGRYVKQAYMRYETEQYEGKVTVPINFYVGYPVHQMPENVSGAALEEKEAIFFAYAQYDGGVCHSDVECNNRTVYGTYLKRQYQNPY